MCRNGIVGFGVVGQLQTEQRIIELTVTDMYMVAVHPCSPALPGIVARGCGHITHHAKEYLFSAYQCDTHGIRRKGVYEIGCSVQWVNHPTVVFSLIGCR